MARAGQPADHRQLGWDDIPVRVVSLENLLAAERDENTVREDFAPTEAVAIGRAIEEAERKKAKERQREAGGDKRSKAAKTNGKIASGKLPEPNQKPPSRESAASAVGMSGKTYRKAQAVVEAAEADPEHFGDLPEKMDQSGWTSPDSWRRRPAPSAG